MKNSKGKVAKVNVVKLLDYIMSGINDEAKCVDGWVTKSVSGNYDFLIPAGNDSVIRIIIDEDNPAIKEIIEE